MSSADKGSFDSGIITDQDIVRAASTSFDVAKSSDLNAPLKFQPIKQFKSPYNHNTKKNTGGSSKKRSIESDLKDISTHVSNTHHSDSRYKAALLNAKTENS